MWCAALWASRPATGYPGRNGMSQVYVTRNGRSTRPPGRAAADMATSLSRSSLRRPPGCPLGPFPGLRPGMTPRRESPPGDRGIGRPFWTPVVRSSAKACAIGLDPWSPCGHSVSRDDRVATMEWVPGRGAGPGQRTEERIDSCRRFVGDMVYALTSE